MPVTYGGVDIRPGPQVTIGKEIRNAGDGRRLNDVVTATLKGFLVPEKIDGVEAAVSIEARLTTILAQQKALRDVFAVDGKLFQVQGWDDGIPVRFPARVRSITFDEGIWVSVCPYEVVLEGPNISGEDSSNYHVESCSESWQIEEDEQTWMTKVVHSVQAKGITQYDGIGGISTHAWENARSFCTGKLALGWTSIGDSYWSPQSGETIAGGSAAFLSGTVAWSPTHSDTVDEIDGTYSATETWTLSNAGWWEESRLSLKLSDADPNSMVAVSLTGTIHGLFADKGDFAGKFLNATAGWDVVRPELAGRAQDVAGVTLSTHPISAEVDFATHDGTVSYTYEYNNRTLINDTWEVYSVTPHASLEDYKTSVGVSGTIYGVAYLDEDTDPLVRIARSTARWEVVEPLLIARAVSISGVTDLKAFPVSANFTPNQADGTITYQYEFDNREVDSVNDDFTVDKRYSRENGQTMISISGTVKGYRTSHADHPYQLADRSELYNNALAYFNQKEPNLIGVAAIYVGTELVNPLPWTKSVSHNPKGGTVAYQYEFTSQKGPCTPGALSESITITDTYATPLFAALAVPGKPEGPIIQDMKTVTAKEREVVVEVVFPPGDPCAKEPPSDLDLTSYAPAGNYLKVTRNVRSWNPTSNRLNRTMAWIYTA